MKKENEEKKKIEEKKKEEENKKLKEKKDNLRNILDLKKLLWQFKVRLVWDQKKSVSQLNIIVSLILKLMTQKNPLDIIFLQRKILNMLEGLDLVKNELEQYIRHNVWSTVSFVQFKKDVEMYAVFGKIEESKFEICEMTVSSSVSLNLQNIVNKKNLTFECVTQLLQSYVNNNALGLFELDHVIKAGLEAPFVSYLKTQPIMLLLKLALDLVSNTSNSGLFSSFTVNGSLHIPKLFLEMIVQFFKKFELNFYRQRLTIRFKSLENIFFQVVDFINIKRLLFQKELTTKPPKTLSFPSNLELLTTLQEIPNLPTFINYQHAHSQLIIKSGENVYLNESVWDEIRSHKNCHQYVVLPSNQYTFEAILILGNIVLFFQSKTKLKPDDLETKTSNNVIGKFETIVPVLEEMGIATVNARFILICNVKFKDAKLKEIKYIRDKVDQKKKCFFHAWM